VAVPAATRTRPRSDGKPHGPTGSAGFSEAQFKTLKYRPDLPARFGAYEDAEAFCQRFSWYNTEHRHSALGLMTPHDLHAGVAAAKWQRRAVVLRAAYAAHPERFPHGVPVPPPLPTATWINKPLSPPRLPMPEESGSWPRLRNIRHRLSHPT
jgi:putative transposase